MGTVARMGEMMAGRRLTASLASTLLVLGACSGDQGSPDSVERQQQSEIYHGTPADHQAAMRECYERAGFATEDDPQSAGAFSIEAGDTPMETVIEVEEACQDEVGEFTAESPPDDYLRRLYEHQLWQRECIADLGFQVAPSPSWERYRELLRSEDTPPDAGTDPFQDLSDDAGMVAQEECPYLDEWEARNDATE